MHQDVFKAHWPQIRTQVPLWWDALTDKDLEQIEGNAGRLVELLQRKYGTSKEYTEREFERCLDLANLVGSSEINALNDQFSE